MHVLVVLQEYLETVDSPRTYSAFVPMILVNMQTYLESAQLYLYYSVCFFMGMYLI